MFIKLKKKFKININIIQYLIFKIVKILTRVYLMFLNIRQWEYIGKNQKQKQIILYFKNAKFKQKIYNCFG